ncbi:MAG TPA: 7-cyano-7-deazaguanine synthase [Ktedonobacterales bacterium]
MSAQSEPGARPAIVLLSGGLDSSTALAIAVEQGFTPHAISFRYGQRHTRELEAAQAIGRHFGVRDHKVIDIDLRAFGGSALTDDIAVPHDRSVNEMGHGIPVTYVPGRNLIFLSLATAYAEVAGANDIFLGINALDYSVAGNTQIWVRCAEWARLMSIEDCWRLPLGKYETISVDPETLTIVWRPITDRLRHTSSHKLCYHVVLERGRDITITEDHSLFTIDPATARISAIKGSDIKVGTPLVVPYDLSAGSDAWLEDLEVVDLEGLVAPRSGISRKSSVIRDGDVLTNRLKLTRVPVKFPITDDFLYIVGLWLAEGGKHHDTNSTTLAFSIGGTPGAADTLRRFFAQYQVDVHKSSANEFDHSISSSVFDAVFHFLGLFGTARSGTKRFPTFFWRLSQRQRRMLVAGLWDGDGSHIFNGEAVFAQKSHHVVDELYHCLALDGIFPITKLGKHAQKLLVLGNARDFRTFAELYPLRHPTKIAALQEAGMVVGRDKSVGVWKCEGVWAAVAAAKLPVGRKTIIYNTGGKYDVSVRAQRSAFVEVPALQALAQSKLAFLRVRSISETKLEHTYDLSVEGAQNFIANGFLAHNSGYPDCRPEFLESFQRTANLATKAGTEDGRTLQYHAPLIQMSKAEIVREGTRLGVPWQLTWSCYEGNAEACGTCDSCQLRLKGFAEAGLNDPLPYKQR